MTRSLPPPGSPHSTWAAITRPGESGRITSPRWTPSCSWWTVVIGQGEQTQRTWGPNYFVLICHLSGSARARLSWSLCWLTSSWAIVPFSSLETRLTDPAPRERTSSGWGQVYTLDLALHMTVWCCRQVFGLYGQTTGKGKVARSELHGRPLELFMCSVLKRQGYGEGFR